MSLRLFRSLHMSFNCRSLILMATLASLPVIAMAQSGAHARMLITKTVDENRIVTLVGNTRSAANVGNDMGRVADNLPMDHMLLQLQHSPEQQQALDQFIDELHNPSSANYHKWLTAAQFGEQFGLAQQDLNTITAWLESKGLTVNSVYPNGTIIDFSGTAGAVQSAFRTEIHNLNVNGEMHLANMSDPQIPEALAPAIKGIVSLHDFRPRQMNRPKPQYTFSSGGSTYQAVVPADLATIYNFTPLFTASKPITGQGQTIAVIEDANLYSETDWKTFQSTFGLTSYGGSLVQINPAPPTGRNNCRNPGTGSGDDVETAVDAEWALAAAPGATIEVAACASTNTTFGGLTAMLNLLNGKNPPAIMSISYGECEAENGATANAAYYNAYEQAVAEHVSVFVAAGDEGAASCDAGANVATHGIGVSGFASTPFNVAVGGTDFGDTYAGTNSTYWSSTNNSVYGSAKSYVPEIPWNDSCASELIASHFGSTSVTYGPNGFCNTNIGKQNFLTVAGGSGGPSGCATGAPSTPGVVSGSCAGYQKPSWQAGLTPGSVRDIPDVSLFAGNGVWGHFYVVCFSDIRNGGASCKGAPSTWAGAGGTSFAAPIMAGVQALINQKTGTTWGNPNMVYYSLAAGNSYCNSGTSGSTCIFNDVTQGDIDMDCSGTNSCYGSSVVTTTGSGRHGRGGQEIIYGALSTSDTTFTLAYPATSGWDFATGIGTVNVANLVAHWH